MTFIDSAPAYLEPHGTPSGGDWAVSRTAALFLQGVNLGVKISIFVMLTIRKRV